MLRFVISILVCFFIASSECREGWKTDGNGYLIYNAETNMTTTSSLVVTGTFATKPNSTNENVVLAFEDDNGNFTAQFMIDGGAQSGSRTNFVRLIEAHSSVIQTSARSYKVNTGYAYNFTCFLLQRPDANGTISHSFWVYIRGFTPFSIVVKDTVTWNLDSMKIYIGGYRTSVNKGKFFEGCLSSFVFNDVDMIGEYFNQYPNNTNPIRSPVVIGTFSNVTEKCNDIARSIPTRKSPVTKPSSTIPSAAIKNTSKIGFVLVNIMLILLYCM